MSELLEFLVVHEPQTWALRAQFSDVYMYICKRPHTHLCIYMYMYLCIYTYVYIYVKINVLIARSTHVSKFHRVAKGPLGVDIRVPLAEYVPKY